MARPMSGDISSTLCTFLSKISSTLSKNLNDILFCNVRILFAKKLVFRNEAQLCKGCFNGTFKFCPLIVLVFQVYL